MKRGAAKEKIKEKREESKIRNLGCQAQKNAH
jgi:hypothetical protein